MADKTLDLVDIDDLGGVVVPLFDDREKWIGKVVGVAGDTLTMSQLAQAFTKATGQKARYEPGTLEEMARWSVEFANMFRFYQDFAGKIRDAKLSRQIYPQIKNAETYFASKAHLWK